MVLVIRQEFTVAPEVEGFKNTLLLLFKESLIFAKQINAGGLVGPALANSGKGCGLGVK
jgi:hypothetical protein